MEDPQTLLMMVLKQHFRDRPQILDEALHIIKEYSNQDSTEEQYEKTVQILRKKMNDLPIDILLYFLNMVPLPKQVTENFKSSVAEEVQKNSFQLDNIRFKLVEYLNSKIPPLISLKRDPDKKPSLTSDFLRHNGNPIQYVRPKRVWRRRGRAKQKDCKALLDICSEYVIKNQNKLKKLYKTKKEFVWSLVNSNKYENEDLVLLYDVIEDLNKKEKFIRMIDSEDVCFEVLMEEYGESDVLLKERQIYETVTEDPFEITDDLREAVSSFVDNF
nr:uncharacterized protein LOC111422902 [Onthophagus taurus]